MLKRDELTNPASCMSRARDDEMTFVLLERDESAPDAIRAWIASRIRRGKNKPGDPQLVEAEQCARMIAWRHAPPNADEIIRFNAFQRSGRFHPLTCGSGRRTDAQHTDGEGLLIATAQGIRCPFCGWWQAESHPVNEMVLTGTIGPIDDDLRSAMDAAGKTTS